MEIHSARGEGFIPFLYVRRPYSSLGKWTATRVSSLFKPADGVSGSESLRSRPLINAGATHF